MEDNVIFCERADGYERMAMVQVGGSVILGAFRVQTGKSCLAAFTIEELEQIIAKAKAKQ